MLSNDVWMKSYLAAADDRAKLRMALSEAYQALNYYRKHHRLSNPIIPDIEAWFEENNI